MDFVRLVVALLFMSETVGVGSSIILESIRVLFLLDLDGILLKRADQAGLCFCPIVTEDEVQQNVILRGVFAENESRWM